MSSHNIYHLRGNAIHSDKKLMISNGKATIVFCFADWCGFCQRTKPVFQSMADKHSSKLNFATVNYSKDISPEEKSLNGKVSAMFGVSAFPTFLLFDSKGKHVDTIQGALPEDEMMKRLSKFM